MWWIRVRIDHIHTFNPASDKGLFLMLSHLSVSLLEQRAFAKAGTRSMGTATESKITVFKDLQVVMNSRMTLRNLHPLV